MKANYTHISIVLDRSSSMQIVRKDTIGGFNKFLVEQKAAPGEATLTLAKFSDNYEVAEMMTPLPKVRELDENSYEPNGWTALHGAIGRTIESTGSVLKRMKEPERPEKVIFVIITDGEENSSFKYEWSRAWDKEAVRKMIELQSGVYKWQFVFIGANQDAVVNAHQIGIEQANAINYVANMAGTQSLYDGLSSNTVKYRSGASRSMSWSHDQHDKQAKAGK